MTAEEKWVEAFQWFHQHPELSYQEYHTTAKIKEYLEEAGVAIEPYRLETGLVAVIKGAKSGPVRALRCDIDALPITEKTELSYQSATPGVMHACGHDFHVVAGIGTAAALQQQRDVLKGTVKILFQPAEETSLGALKLLETLVMEDVDFIWGIHADPTNETGVIGISEGGVTAAVDRFRITIQGKGAHGAHPDDGTDPIPAMAATIQALQTIVTRNVNAFHPNLISVTHAEAGNTWNVIPETAFLEGTVRTLDKKDRELFEKRVKEIAEATAQAYGSQAVTEWIPGPPATINDKKMVETCIRTAKEQRMVTVPEERSMGGDDFSFYQERIPGCYMKIGTGKGEFIHQPGFQVDTAVINQTVKYLKALLMETME